MLLRSLLGSGEVRLKRKVGCMMLEFTGWFGYENLYLKHFDYWTIMLRFNQITIGSCIIVLNRECPNFSEIKPEEMAEFPQICAWFEEKCKKIYGAEKFNYLAMMMKDHFVHFHALPRYSTVVDRYDMQWVDEDWPKGAILRDIKTDDDILRQMKEDFIKEQ